VSTNVIKIGRLPKGETILWRGAPTWRGLMMRAFHLRAVLIYFSALLLWHAVDAWWTGTSLQSALKTGAWLFIPVTAGSLLIAALAWLTMRSTHYTITNKRILMQTGIALPATLNLPFNRIASAGLKIYKDGTGDIPLSLNGEDRLAYILLWPHARPWHIARPEPMIRSVPDISHVAEILTQALKAAEDTLKSSPEKADEPASLPAFAAAAE